MGIVYRRAGLDDAPAASSILAAAQNDLNQRHGFGHINVSPNPQNPHFVYCLNEEPEGIWVAEKDGQAIGFSLCWVRGSFWFLAQLFVLPGFHGQGVGQMLLEKALVYGSAEGVTNRALITFAYNPVSISLYARQLIYPRESLYTMVGQSQTVRDRWRAQGTDDRLGEIAPGALERVSGLDEIQLLRGIDEDVVGFPRDRDHRFLLQIPGSACYCLQGRGVPEGYVYVSADGRIGPLAVRSPEKLAGLLLLGLRQASETAEQISILVAGSNEQAMSLVLRHGLRIDQPLLLMASRPFGRWGCYVFRSPGLM